jgi:uncharacterized membrane protein YGL010W
MSRLDPLLARYGESHCHRVNKAIHWICVPLITWSVIAGAWLVHPLAAAALVLVALAYYIHASPPIALGMLAVSAVMIGSLPLLGGRLAAVAATVFVLAWLGQFAGHRIEGRRPSFLEDVKFLLVGPAWLLAALYRRLGLPH